MRFRKRRGKSNKVDWKWKGKMIKEVKKLQYLGYTLQRNGGHVKDSEGGDNDWDRYRRLGKKDSTMIGREGYLMLIWAMVSYGVEI